MLFVKRSDTAYVNVANGTTLFIYNTGAYWYVQVKEGSSTQAVSVSPTLASEAEAVAFLNSIVAVTGHIEP